MAAINQKIIKILNQLELVYDATANISYIKETTTYKGGGVCRRIHDAVTNAYISQYINRTDNAVFITSSQQKQINEILHFKAKNEGEKKRVHKRFSQGKLTISVSLGKGRSLIISKSFCSEIKNKKKFFLEHINISPIDDFDINNGDINLLKKYLLISDEEFILVVVFMVNMFFTRNPQLILNITGAPGSGKTRALKIIKKIIDPSIIVAQNQPDNIKDLVVSAGSSYLLTFDNVSNIPEKIQNILCLITTGGTSADRALNTNADQYIIKTKNPIILTSIKCPLTRQDVLQRALTIDMHPIDQALRKTEQSLNLEFDKDLPKIRGGLYRIVQGVLIIRDGFKGSEELTRMADFDELGQMVEKANGWSVGSFKAAYHSNLSIPQSDLIEASELANAIILFSQSQSQEFRGTCTELGNELRKISLIKITSARQLSSDINKVSDALYALHRIKIQRLNRSGGKNLISISRIDTPSHNQEFS